MWDMSDRYKQAMRGYHVPAFRVRAMSTVQFGYPSENDGLLLDVIRGDVNFTSTADIKSTLDLTVAGYHWDTLKPFGVEIFAERGVDYGDGTVEFCPLGFFRVQKPKQDDAPDGPIVVAASDRGVRLKEHRVISPYNYPSGITHRQIFDQLVNGYSIGPTPYDVITYPMYYGKKVPITFLGYDPDSALLPSGVVDDWVYDFLAKIADARGCVIRFDRLGGMLVDARDRAPGTPPVYTIEPGVNGNLIKFSRELSREQTYNVVAARGSDPAYPTGLGLTYNDDIDSPLNFQGSFEAVVRKYASPLLHTTDQAGSASRKLVLRYTGLPSGTSAVTLPDPSIEPLDVLLLRPAGLPDELAVADTVKVPLDVVTPVTVATRAQNQVSDEPDTTGTDDGSGPVFKAAFRDARAYPAITGTGASTVVNVSTAAQLTTALGAAVAGQVITLADGSYSGTFTISRKGTAAQPIVIKAANVGKAVLVSGSKFIADGAEYVLVSGLSAPYDQAGDTFLMKGACRFVRYTRIQVGPSTGPAVPDTYKIGFSSCINATNSAALQRAASMNLDYWYNSGDTWYKDGNTPAWNSDWNEKFATTEYAALIASLKRGKQWVNVSDHEGYANDAPSSAFGSAFQTAYRTQFPEVAAQLPSVGIYRAWVIGRIQYIQLDQRSFRSLDSATDNSSKTMLGAAQKQWFKNLISANAYPLVIVLGDVPIHTPTQAGDDSWAGFDTERNELKAVFDASTSKFVYLHGNMHALMRKANTFGYDLALGAAPLNNLTKVSAAGANIDASYPTNANEGTVAQQFGVVTITDNGTSTITVGFKGYDADGTERTTVATSLTVTAPGSAATDPAAPQGNYFHITDQSQDCVIDYCELRNKTRPGNGIAVDGTLNGGTTSPGVSQTLGVGGIPKPAAGPNVVLISADSTSTLNITTSGKTYDGQGHTVPKINITADNVTVQNFYVSGASNSGIVSEGSGNTIQNCDISHVAEAGTGDINGITFFGDNTKILFNNIDSLVQGAPGSAHTDGVQTWNTPSHRSSSNVLIYGNRINGPVATDPAYIHQGVMAEGKDSTDGGGGGTGTSQNWLVDSNYFKTYGNQCLKFDDIDNVKITRNKFDGNATKIVETGSLSVGTTYYSDNVVTGTYGSVGVSATAGNGPAPSTFGYVAPSSGTTSAAPTANADGCQHILIAHNDIHDFGTEIANGFEAIRFGNSDISRTQSNSAVIRNVLVSIRCEPEVISIKMAKVDVWGNALKLCVGGICLRHGTDNYVGHNYIRGSLPPNAPIVGTGGTKTGGIRAYDANHDIAENYIESVNGDTFTGALVIDGGDSAPALSGHWPVKGLKARLNLLVNDQTGILIGPNYTVAPDSIQVAGNVVVAPVGQTTALKTTKAPTGTNVLDPNTYFGTVDAAAMTKDSDDVYHRTGVGPRMTYLHRADVGVVGDPSETDGSGRSLGGTPGGTPTGGGGTPSDPGSGTGGTPATSIANLLKLGKASGFSKCNIGVGFDPNGDAKGNFKSTHHDYTLAEIENGLSVPGYYELTSDGLRAKLSGHINGATTSSNTKYSRVEHRQLNADGTTKTSFNPNEAKTRFVGIMSRVTKMPPNKPQLVLAQSHDANDDTAMLYMSSKTTVQAKLGNTVVGTLDSAFVFGTDYYGMIKIIGDGSKCKLQYFWGKTPADMANPKFTTDNATRSTTWYLKAGCYIQSNTDYDSVSDGPFIVEMTKCVFWETGMPAPLGWV